MRHHSPIHTTECGADESQVQFCGIHQGAWQIWRLIPVEIEVVDTPLQYETLGLGLSPYDGNESGKSSASAQYLGSDRDDFGTVVTEVKVVTTRKRYRANS